MKKSIVFFRVVCFAVFLAFFSGNSRGDEEGGDAKPRLTAGSLTTILPEINYSSTHNYADLVEVLASLPAPPPELADDVRFNQEIWAKKIRYERPVWGLEFSFKPIRIIYVNIPNKEDGKFVKKAVWYWIYKVRNPGPADLEKVAKEQTARTDDGEQKRTKTEFDNMNPGGSVNSSAVVQRKIPVSRDMFGGSQNDVPAQDELVLRNIFGSFEPQSGKDEPLRFIPQFLLTTGDLVERTVSANNPATGKLETAAERISLSYADQIIPLAIPVMMKREGMVSKPETTVTFPRKSIASGEEYWGVAMWTDIDPRIHRFSIYITGLTNAYEWKDDGTNSGKAGEGRSMKRKILKTNWRRIGDQYNVNDAQIQYGNPGTVDFEWIFL
jgi:hypothetical protein